MNSIKETMDIEVTFGPLAQFMRDETVEEIWINSPERIFIARAGKSELTNLLLTTAEVHNIVERALMWSGRRLDLSHPFVDARMPDGSRLHVTIPEITAEHWAVNIRKHLLRHLNLSDLISRGVLTEKIAQLLKYSVHAGLNILVSGATQSGKTTMLNALASTIPVSERVITIEEVFELKPNLPDVVQMQTRSANLQGSGEIPLRRLIKESLRMRPSRIIVGEVREAEALDLLIALNSGLPGMGTLHANSPKDAIIKLQTLPLLAGENISHKFIAPTVAAAIDLIIHVQMDQTGKRRISEIAALTGRYENDRPEIESLWKWNIDHYIRGLGALPKPEKFAAIGFPLESWWNK
jgi:pilus assembly protein CpaF